MSLNWLPREDEMKSHALFKGDDYFAMGSGPMRAAAGREELFNAIGFRETADECVGVLESGCLPQDAVCRTLAGKCGVPMDKLTLLVAPTKSLACTVQVVARSVETALHKLHELGFDIARIESGFEDAGRIRLDDIARRDPADDPMAPHAATLVYNHREDPYLAFRRLKRSQSWALVRYRFFADWTKGTRYPNLPKPVAYLVESPGVAQTFATTPLRLVFGAWSDHPDFDQPTAVAAYRYLGLEPEGEHQER